MTGDSRTKLLFGLAAVIAATALLLAVVSRNAEDETPPLPVAVPTPTQVAAVPDAPPAGTPLVVEDWSAFEGTDALLLQLELNEGWADNDLKVALVDSGVAAAYTIRAEAPDDYVGFEWLLSPRQDWRGYRALNLDVSVAAPTAHELVVQWYEASGEVWRHRVAVGGDQGFSGPVSIPLDEAAWEWADWSARVDGTIGLDAVVRVGIFVGHGGPLQGEVAVGTLSLLP